jgi:hypothetical protein
MGDHMRRSEESEEDENRALPPELVFEKFEE